MKPGGIVIVATFGPDAPEKCNGLEVVHYDADLLHDEFGATFTSVDSRTELHQAPFGTTQQFLYMFVQDRITRRRAFPGRHPIRLQCV